MVLSQLLLKGYNLVAFNLEKLSGNVYPDQFVLSQALVQTLGQNIAKPVTQIILKQANLGERKFTQNFGWINHFENVIFD